jgi:hypothetical protein
MNTGESRTGLLQRLLATASALSLLAMGVSRAQAEEADRPTVWIELGAQLERVDGGLERFAPPFVGTIDTSAFTSPIVPQKPPRYAIGGEAKFSFQPEESDWIVSAGLRYGRSNNSRRLHQETVPPSPQKYIYAPLLSPEPQIITVDPETRRYADTVSRHDESHAVLDFQAGKDVGLGMFGAGGKSVFSAGVRFAQLTSKSQAVIGADPDFGFHSYYTTKIVGVFPFPIPGKFIFQPQSWHLYRSQMDTTRSFHGIGPSASWDASAPLVGSPDRVQLMFDWGVNAALLFGRQKMRSSHTTNSTYRYQNLLGGLSTVAGYNHPYSTARSRSVTIPNVGGFAGFSVKFPNAKVSLGYRADVFFGAVDGGIDARKTYDRAFYGPFATISFGMGG